MQLLNLDFYFFPMFRKLSAVIALSILSVPFSFSSPFGSLIITILFPLLISHKPCRLSSFFFILFSFCSSDWIISNALSSSSLMVYSASLSLLLKFSIEYFSAIIVFFSPNFCMIYFYDFYLMVEFFTSF